MSKTFIPKRRLRLITVAIFLFWRFILGRLYYLHIGNEGKLLRIVERNRQKFEVSHARRGNILDKRGDLLATTRSMVELGVDPQAVREEEFEKLNELSNLISADVEQIKPLVEEKIRQIEGLEGKEIRLIRWRRLAESINESTYEKVIKLGINGVYGNSKYERVYPLKSYASHVIGFVNKECTAVGGIEESMNFYLKGQDGWREKECDGRRLG